MSTEEEEPTEVDVIAEKYSKKWGVPLEEAKKNIQKFMGRKPEEKSIDRSRVTPDAGHLFPDPLGPISKKIQDINQAALSTAFTRQSLKEMSQPPEEMKNLREKVDSLEKTFEGTLELVNTTMKEMHETLETKKKEEDREQLLEEVAGIIRPLKEKVEALESVKAGRTESMSELTAEKIVEAGQEATEKAKLLLQKQGFNVEIPKGMTIEQAEAKIKEVVEKAKEVWAKDAGVEVQVETERIRATENILTNAIDRVFDIFLEPVKLKIQEAIDRGAFKAPGA